ncbi:hypothetical protein CRUP_038477, partial [Coryphaenoides rupestris]
MSPMGVLMSKKQQVEKVQKCNAVVSAFQQGIKISPPPANQDKADEDGGGAADAPAKRSAGEEGGEEEEANAAPPPTRDECNVNQEAWSQMRDGKGVEPEDLQKSHQLTPPAFVRPKREANDDQALEVELGQREQLGYLRAEALQEMRDSAHTVTGWSCYYCDNVNLLLTEEEMYSLQFEKDLTDEQEEEVLGQFAALDPDKKGHIEWSDFLYFESLTVLRKLRTETSMVRLLSAKERDQARTLFLSLDLDKDGLITGGESRQAQQSWFHKLNKDTQSCNV